MANQQPYSYRPVMNRNITRKWAEARQVNYGGDDWGDDGYGPSPDEEPIQNPLSYGQRSFTNPVVDTRQRMSFDREPETRNFSAGPGPAPSLPYGSAQPGPFTAATGQRYYGQSQQPMYEQPQYPQTRAPEPLGRTSMDSFRRDAPRPESRESASVGIHPPRKSSLGQNDFKDYSQPDTLQSPAAAPPENLNAKPLPFIRPADIWKKHEEAEKERRSQESSTRPSLDSSGRDSAEKISPQPAELEQNRRRQPALDTVAERKSEYFDNMVNPSTRQEDQQLNATQIKPVNTSALQASSLPSTSRQTDQPKPIPTTSNVFNAPTTNMTPTRSTDASISQGPSLPLLSSHQTAQSKPIPTTTNLFEIPAPTTTQTRAPDTRSSQGSTMPLDTSRQTEQPKPIPTTTNIFNSAAPDIARTRPTDAPVSQAASLPFNPSHEPDQSRSTSVANISATPTSSTTTEGRPKTADRPALPQISRTSTFGPDFLYSAIPTNQPQTHNASQVPGTKLPSITAQPESRQVPAQPYRSMVQTAFESENRRRDDSPTAESLLRTNTTSTSEISPIVGTSTKSAFESSGPGNAAYARDVPHPPVGHSSNVDPFSPPHRVNTDRRESPSPARRPKSLVAPDIPEPLSAITPPDEQTPAPDTARAAQIVRPGLANLVHQRGPSKEYIHSDPSREIKPKTQGSMDSDASDRSNQRTTSEEWASWNAARSEAHERHGIQDSKPPTPAVPAPHTSASAPFESLDHSVHMPSNTGNSSTTKSTALPILPSQRPQPTRDESFRPSLPGGWMSSTSIEKAQTPEPLASQVRPPLGESVASTESIPTATAPRDANWRSQYRSGPQGGLAAATAAGAAMAGIFNGPSLTLSNRPESEVSSIDENEEGPTGLHRDISMKSRDFAASPEPPQTSKQSASRDFAAATPLASDATPKAKQQPFTKTVEQEKPILALPGQAAYSLPQHSASHDSPTKESDRWSTWSSSEDEAVPAPAPAPLRTNRLSTIEPSHPNISPISRLTDTDNERLESDIVKGLPQKSTSTNATIPQTGGISPTHERSTEKSVSPPFAAAALAVSPGRDYKALEEQNAFQPLTAPSSKTISPVSQKTSQPATGIPPIPITALDQSSLPTHTKPTMPPPPVSLPVLPKQDRASEAPSLPAFDAAKVDPVRLPGHTSESTITSNDFIHGSHPPTLNQKYDRSISTQPSSSDSGVPLTTANSGSPVVAKFHGANTVNEAVTMPTAKAPATNDLTREQPVTPNRDISMPLNSGTQPIVRQPSLARSEVSAISAPSAPIIPKTTGATRTYDPLRAFPSDKFSNEQISNMASPTHRINAYNENRIVYAESTGHLENWLSYMNTPENAGHFSTRPMDTSSYASSERFDKRDSSGPPSSIKMGADGKRMLASASKMGQKASVLGKGLFSKGKEKLRTASASQKGSIASQSTDRIVPDTRQPSIASISNAPQLPEPSMATPLEESSLSAYFAGRDGHATAPTVATDRSTARTANDPPFSPISDVSSNHLDKQKTLDRAISAVSEQQSTQSTSTARPSTTIARTQEDSKGRTATSQTAIGGNRISMDLLRADGTGHHRRDSSVSDVSSVSDRLMRNQSQATRTISPQAKPESALDISAPPTRNISTTIPIREQQSQNASLATNMAATTLAAKEAEARQDRVEEQTLPKYEQARPQQPRIASGAQIIPIARISQNPDQEATSSSRPFSFIGNESLSKTGYPTNQSIDNPGIATGLSGTRGSDIVQMTTQQHHHGDHPAENPLPSARRNPEEYGAHARTPEEFAKLRQNAPVIQTKPEQSSAFRIPGPYGQELRSPKPKASSPMLDHAQTASPSGLQGDTYEKPLPHAMASGNVPYDGRNRPAEQNLHQQSYDGQNSPGVPLYPMHSHHDSNQPMSQNYPSQYQQEAGPDGPLRHQRSLNESLAEHERAQAEERRERSRASKFTSMFRTRSRSRSRRLRKEQNSPNYVEQRPVASKRNSLIQTRSRSNVPQVQPQSANQAPSWYNDEVVSYDTQSSARPGAGTRRLSKDLFKNAQYGQQGLSQSQYEQQPRQQQQQLQPLPTATGKKNRLSGLFGKSRKNEQTLQRAQTMPMNYDPQQANQQQPHVQPPQGYQHQGQQQFQPPQVLQAPSHDQHQAPGLLGYHQQTTMPHGYEPQPSHMHEQDRQNPVSQQGMPGQRFDGMPPHAEGYYGSRPDDLHRQSSQQQYGQHPHEQRFMDATISNDSRHQTGTQYPDNQYGQGYQQGRPDLPRLNTHDRAPQGSQSLAMPLGSHISPQPHDNQQIYPAPGHTNTLSQGPYQPPTTRANKDISYGSDFPRSNTFGAAPVSAPPGPVQVQTTAPLSAESGSKITPRVAALHTRSRSPKLGRRDSSDLNEEFSAIQNSHSPVAGLGAFHNKKVSPMDGVPRHEGEQEKPFVIGLPGAQGQRTSMQDDTNSAASSKAREMKRIMLERSPVDQGMNNQQGPHGQTVADRFMGIPPTGPTTSKQSGVASPVSAPPVRNVMLSKNPSLRGREPVNRSTSTTPVNSHTAANGHSILGSPTGRNANLASETRPPVPSIPSAKAVQTPLAPVSAPPVPVLSQQKTAMPPIPGPRALTPPQPAISPPPPPHSKAAAPTMTNEAGVTKALPAPRAGKVIEMHELPGSRPDGYESEEEIVMSATAFPGQEWMPVFDKWED